MGQRDKIEVFRKGLKVFESKKRFKAWLITTLPTFKAKPKDMSKDEILILLGRVDHGIYS